MADNRERRAKLNIVTSLMCQFVTLICGIVIPRVMLESFGSEVYGATASVAQFLSYIALLEGGIGGVARAALYKPLANNDIRIISAVVKEIKKFFRVIGYIFFVYVLIIACSFKNISNIESLDWISTFLLVLAISVSTFGQYFIGISNSILLQASQKLYITQLISIITIIINTIFVIILTHMDCNIIVVKLMSSCIFILKPIILYLYVKRKYKISDKIVSDEKYLKQKWTGLGQHLAYFLHSNTDVMVLTIFSNLANVAIYSIYNMVIIQMQHLTTSFSSGMEAVYGDMLAKKEYKELNKTFGYYEMLISLISVILFSTTATMIIPFVRIYTMNIDDVNYIVPLFSILMILASLLYCLRMPYHSIIIAAGYFKQTRMAAYGEAVINIVISIVLVKICGLIGVAIGTVVATLYRFVYYAVYLSKNIIKIKIFLFVKREFVNIFAFALILFVSELVMSKICIVSYAQWAICGICVFVVSALITVVFNAVFYRETFKNIIMRFKKDRSGL